MLRSIHNRLNREERGFTLIELLVVILIIGILAAIALPAFLGQRSKGQDSNAKSDARNLVSEVESCFTDRENYTSCSTTAANSLGTTGLPIGGNTGDVTVSAAGTDGYTISARSKSGNTFSILKDSNGSTTRTCNTDGTGKGGCNTDTW